MLNVITLVGRLTRDPELRKTNSGTQGGFFTIACDDGRKNANGEKEVLFMDCAIFGAQADVLAKYFQKGSLIGVYGRLTSRKYTNKQGAVVTAYNVVCDRIEFVESKKDGEAQQQPENASKPQEASPIVEKGNIDPSLEDDDSLPF